MATPNHQPLLDVSQNQLALIFADSDSIDTKGLALLGTNVAILIFIAQANLHIANWLVGLVLLGSLIGSVVFDTLAIWPRPYVGSSVDLAEYPEYFSMEEADLILQLISDTQHAIEENQRLNLSRWRFCLISLVLLIIGTITLGVILVVA